MPILTEQEATIIMLAHLDGHTPVPMGLLQAARERIHARYVAIARANGHPNMR